MRTVEMAWLYGVATMTVDKDQGQSIKITKQSILGFSARVNRMLCLLWFGRYPRRLILLSCVSPRWFTCHRSIKPIHLPDGMQGPEHDPMPRM